MKLSVNTTGVLMPLEGRGKENKLIPWSMIKKESVVPAVKRCTNDKHGLDIYMVRKIVNGEEHNSIHLSEREALKAVDLHLINNGKEPKYILKLK